MKRLFQTLSEDVTKQEDYSAYLAVLNRSVGFDWSELLRSKRILIVSEAGAGKTYECQLQQHVLWEQGEAAFYLELSQLSAADVPDMLSPVEKKRFEEWRNSQSDIATFFLDAYDELKITLGSFRQALKRLANAVDGHLGRARIVVTSRPVPVDQYVFQEILPTPPEAEDVATGEAFADVVMKGPPQKKDEGPPDWINVALLPFGEAQIVEMAKSQRVTDTDALLADIRRRNAIEFARRPQDLIELCADWRDHRQIRTHLEQVQSSVTMKLSARPERPELASLSVDRAMDGASRLALALLLTRKLTVRHSAAADIHTDSTAALDPARLLPDWTSDERATLLERPMFGFASYGRVRFHHRSAIEFLSAQRLKALMDHGYPIKAVHRLLFAETLEGRQVVRPTMRAVAAWLALDRPTIFEQIVVREPEVLIDYGDPESLPLTKRQLVLRAFVKRHGTGGWRGISMPAIQIQRFASADLGPEIQSLWPNIENAEIHEIMLALIAAGKIACCADIANDAAINAGLSRAERIGGLEALVALSDARIDALIDAMIEDTIAWPNSLASWAVQLFPEQLDVERLGCLLARVEEKGKSIGQASWFLPRVIRDRPLEYSVIRDMRRILTTLVCENIVSSSPAKITTKRPFLIEALTAACVREVESGTFSDETLYSCALAFRLSREHTLRDESIETLRSALEKLNGNQRAVIFEKDDALMQEVAPLEEAAKRFSRIGIWGPIRLSASVDQPWIWKQLGDPSLAREARALVLEAAFWISDSSQPEQAVADLGPMVSDDPELQERLRVWAQPREQAPDPEMEALDRKIARQKAKAERDERKAHQSWIDFWTEVAERPDMAFSDSRSKDTVWNMWRAMQRSGRSSREEGWNRPFIERQFGVETANRMRQGLMVAWRADCPTLRSEREESEKNTYLTRWQLGLAAISAEAEDPHWAKALDPDEASLAARFASLTLGGFPAWLDDVVRQYPASVDAVLGEELSFELTEPANLNWHSSLLMNVEHASSEIGRFFLPRLEQWLASEEELFANFDAHARANRLAEVLRILLKHGTTDTRIRMHALVQARVAGGIQGSLGLVLLPALMRLDAEAGVYALEQTLSSLPVEQHGEAIQWIGSMFGERRADLPIEVSSAHFSPSQLLRLTQLAYRHVRKEDDVEHEGTYSPDARDYAERGRSILLTTLWDAKGHDAWSAKLALMDNPMFSHLRDRILAVAIERSAEEADATPVEESVVLDLLSRNEMPPRNREEMFTLLRDRIDDLEELLLRDTSPRAAWAAINEEVVLRPLIARELEIAARKAYTVDQEAVTADNKETDIRLRSSLFDQQAVIELKIGDKSRSAAELRDALRSQLVDKYLAPQNSRSGCLLITIAGDRTWNDPDSGAPLDFTALICMLRKAARQLETELAGEVRLCVKGVDLRPRLGSERYARSRKKQQQERK